MSGATQRLGGIETSEIEPDSIRSGPVLMSWRKAHGISRPLFAEIVGCSERTLATYEGKQELPEKFVRPVRESMRLIEALRELAGDDGALRDWLQLPNAAFSHKTPIALIKDGESDLLWQMVYQLRQGAFA